MEACLKQLTKQKGSPTDLNPVLAMAMSNVICAIMMSVRFQHDDTRFKKFMHLIDEGFKLFGSLEAINFIPAMRYMPGFQATRKKLAQVIHLILI